jgi:hypothetical protein
LLGDCLPRFIVRLGEEPAAQIGGKWPAEEREATQQPECGRVEGRYAHGQAGHQ